MKRSMAVLAVAAAIAAIGLMSVGMAAGLGDRSPQIPAAAGKVDGRIVVVNFWASWCGPCVEELPQLDAMAKRLKALPVTVLAVNLDVDRSKAAGLMEHLKVGLEVVFDPEGALAGKFEPPAMPTTYIVDGKGVIRHVHAGFDANTVARVEADVRALAEERNERTQTPGE